MVRIPPMEEIVRSYIKGSLEAFLEGKKNLNWIKGVIRKSGILKHKGVLQGVFENLRTYENLPRYQEVLQECQKEGWL